MGKLIILSGPSCIGKSPLYKALKRFYPDTAAGLHPICFAPAVLPAPVRKTMWITISARKRKLKHFGIATIFW